LRWEFDRFPRPGQEQLTGSEAPSGFGNRDRRLQSLKFLRS
jgi:hypothetical protein